MYPLPTKLDVVHSPHRQSGQVLIAALHVNRLGGKQVERRALFWVKETAEWASDPRERALNLVGEKEKKGLAHLHYLQQIHLQTP